MIYKYHLPYNKNLNKIALGFIVLTLIGLVPFEYKGRTGNIILSNNILLFAGLIFTMLFGVIALVLKTKSENSKNNPHRLELTDTYLQFPIGKNEVIKADYKNILGANNIGNNVNGSILQVTSKNKAFRTFYIQANGFESMSVYNQFEQELKQKISHQN